LLLEWNWAMFFPPARGIFGFSAAHFVSPSSKLRHWFRRVVLSRGWPTFIVMGLALFVFGVGTYNIFMLLSANVGLIAQYGW